MKRHHLERLGALLRRGPGPVDRGLIRLEPDDHRIDGGRDFRAVTKRFGDGAGLGRAHAKNLLERWKRGSPAFVIKEPMSLREDLAETVS